MRRDVFQAIADPTRREIIHLIAHKSLNLNSVAENFNISRPAISKHIKILMECGLLEINQHGRERYCEARLEKLHEVNDWVEQYRQLWEHKLDALESYLELLQSDSPPKTRTGKKQKKAGKSVKPTKSVKPVKQENVWPVNSPTNTPAKSVKRSISTKLKRRD